MLQLAPKIVPETLNPSPPSNTSLLDKQLVNLLGSCQDGGLFVLRPWLQRAFCMPLAGLVFSIAIVISSTLVRIIIKGTNFIITITIIIIIITVVITILFFTSVMSNITTIAIIPTIVILLLV